MFETRILPSEINIDKINHGINNNSSGRNSYMTKLGSITTDNAVSIPNGIINIIPAYNGPEIIASKILQFIFQ